MKKAKTRNDIKRSTKVLGLCGIIMLALALVFGGCSQTFSPPDTKSVTSQNSSELTRSDHLALLKTQNNHKLSMDELQAIVSKTLTTPGGRSLAPTGSAITGVKKLPLAGERRFAITSSGRSTVGNIEEEPVEVYEFSTRSPENGNEGFVLASNDVRVGTILAVAEGSLDDASPSWVKLLNAKVNDYIAATILEYNSITDSEIAAVLEKIAEQSEEARGVIPEGVVSEYNPQGVYNGQNNSNWSLFMILNDFTIVKAPLLLTNWGQGTWRKSLRIIIILTHPLHLMLIILLYYLRVRHLVIHCWVYGMGLLIFP